MNRISRTMLVALERLSDGPISDYATLFYCGRSTLTFIALERRGLARWLPSANPRHGIWSITATGRARLRSLQRRRVAVARQHTLTLVRREEGRT